MENDNEGLYIRCTICLSLKSFFSILAHDYVVRVCYLFMSLNELIYDYFCFCND